MQWNKRFAWAWVAAGLFAVSGLLGACEPEKSGPGPDADTQPSAGMTTTLPLAVDGTWAASGDMGDGEAQLIQDDTTQCASPRPGSGLGDCHRFTWTPGGAGWGGV